MTTEKKASPKQDNPLVDIIVNVLAPVIILSKCSKEGDSFYHLGPWQAMTIALAIPLCFGIWHFLKNKRLNLFSAVGVGNVLLTGIITIYLYSTDDPAVRENAPWLFGIKEAVQPLILGTLFLITHRSKSPLFNAFVYNDSLFDQPRINKALKEKGNEEPHRKLLWRSTLLFFGSFCISAVLNLFLAWHFLGDLDATAEDWKELYNADVARITGWGYLVIGVPLLIITGFIFWHMIGKLKELTGLETETLMQAR